MDSEPSIKKMMSAFLLLQAGGGAHKRTFGQNQEPGGYKLQLTIKGRIYSTKIFLKGTKISQ